MYSKIIKLLEEIHWCNLSLTDSNKGELKKFLILKDGNQELVETSIDSLSNMVQVNGCSVVQIIGRIRSSRCSTLCFGERGSKSKNGQFLVFTRSTSTSSKFNPTTSNPPTTYHARHPTPLFCPLQLTTPRSSTKSLGRSQLLLRDKRHNGDSSSPSA